MRLLPQRGAFFASGVKVMMPFFFIFTTFFTMPLPFDRLVVVLSLGPLMWTRTPLAALPCWVRWIVSVVLRPAIRWPGVMRLTATQKITCGWTTTTLAVAVLLE